MQPMFPDGVLKATTLEGAAGAVDTASPSTTAAHAAERNVFRTK